MKITATNIVGKSVTFDHASSPKKRLVGVVTSAEDNGKTLRGAIPDLLVTILGRSGKEVTVSLVEAHVEAIL